MTTNLPNRIDRLEALAETTLLAIQQQQTQINDLRTISTDLQTSATDLRVSVTDLRFSVADLRASVADVVGMVGTLAEQQNDMQQEITGLRLESRRILDYLLNQRGESGNNP